jgi:hypothetical protein
MGRETPMQINYRDFQNALLHHADGLISDIELLIAHQTFMTSLVLYMAEKEIKENKEIITKFTQDNDNG